MTERELEAPLSTHTPSAAVSDSRLERYEIVIGQHKWIDTECLIRIKRVPCPWRSVLKRVDGHMFECDNTLQELLRAIEQ